MSAALRAGVAAIAADPDAAQRAAYRRGYDAGREASTVAAAAERDAWRRWAADQIRTNTWVVAVIASASGALVASAGWWFLA